MQCKHKIANIIKGEEGGRCVPADWCRAEWWLVVVQPSQCWCWPDLRLTKVFGRRRPLPTPAAPPPPPPSPSPAADAATSFLLSGPLVVTSTRHCHHHQQQPSIPDQEDPVFTILHPTHLDRGENSEDNYRQCAVRGWCWCEWRVRLQLRLQSCDSPLLINAGRDRDWSWCVL